VQKLARVFLQMRAPDTNAPSGSWLQPAIAGKGQLILGNLVGLGQVRIKIILAGENGKRREAAIESQSGPEGQFHGRVIEHGQDPGLARAYRTDARIGRRAEAVGRTGAKQLAFRRQLHVDL
jgi:hypothetical protein